MMRVTGLGLVLVIAAGIVLTAVGQGEPKSAARAGAPSAGAQPATQPASTQPATGPRTQRPPAQQEIIQGLLRDRERIVPIPPQGSEPIPGKEVAPAGAGAAGEGPALLPDGTTIVERPGRLLAEDGKLKFVFVTDEGQPQLRTMELLPNSYLEAMERLAQGGESEFIITAEVTRYKQQNYLLLHKVLHRVGHGNLGP